MQSIWYAKTGEERRKEHSKLMGDHKTDVLVIGGGMAGILCAHALREKGVGVTVVEAERIGLGVTQNTTAKITAQHGLIYQKILTTYGIETAARYYEANRRALNRYRELAGRIPCDFEEKSAYVDALRDMRKLDLEAEAYGKIGIPFTTRKDAPIPVRIAGALGISDQAKFNPLKLLYALAESLTVYENTRVIAIDDHVAVTDYGRIRADVIIVTTHFPFIKLRGLYFMKMYQHRSYVVALRGAETLDGMYIDEREEGHSFRDYRGNLLIGGGDHKTGAKGGGWQELRSLAMAAYPAAREEYAWATQDCMTLDGMPYIGRLSRNSPDLYVATGFNKWGMTGSMVASEVLAEMIVDGKSECSEVFSPNRRMTHPQLLVNAASAIGHLLYPSVRRCTHLGCALKWNDRERTWDCPCHGSRFGEDGHVIDNPALRRIEP